MGTLRRGTPLQGNRGPEMSSEAMESVPAAAEPPAILPQAASLEAGGVIRVGDRAVATSPLCPGGVVTVHGRRHSARLTEAGGEIAMPGAELVIVGGDNGGFVVRLASPHLTIDLPRRGDPVHGSFGAAIQSDARRNEKRREVFERVRARGLRVRGFAAGAAAGLLAVAICWLWPSVSWPAQAWMSVSVVLGVPLGFGLAAAWLARQLDERFAETDSNLRGLSLPTTFLMLLGAAAGGAWAIPRLGLLSGIGVAAIAAFVLGSPLPAIVMLVTAGAEEAGLDGTGVGAGDGGDASGAEQAGVGR